MSAASSSAFLMKSVRVISERAAARRILSLRPSVILIDVFTVGAGTVVVAGVEFFIVVPRLVWLWLKLCLLGLICRPLSDLKSFPMAGWLFKRSFNGGGLSGLLWHAVFLRL